MTRKPQSHKTANTSRKIPLRLILVVPFVLQTFAAVGLTGYLSIRNGQRAVNDVATQLRSEITKRIEQKLIAYVEIPHLVNQINADAIELGMINLDKIQEIEGYLLKQMQQFDTLTGITFGIEKPDYIGVARYPDSSDINLAVWNQAQGGTKRIIVDSQGNRFKVTDNRNYDHRRRPWYQAAVSAGKPIWTDIYIFIYPQNLTLSARYPLYDDRGNLLGVIGAVLSLEEISEFLSSLQIGKTGQTFIIDGSGLLVATSTPEKPFRINQNQPDPKPERLQAIDSSDALIASTARYLADQFGDLSNINSSQQLDFMIDGNRQFIQVLPFQDDRGLEWLIVVVVPETDFMEQINANTRTTIILCLEALALATVLSIFTSRWIAKPIQRLSRASRAIASGSLDQKIEVKAVVELEVLADAFNQMAVQLKESFEELENRVQERTAELKSAKEEAEAAKVAADTANKAKSEFLANMSHELRTPLNGILGYAQILLGNGDATPKQRDGIGIIRQCGEHLLTLINDILDISKIEARKLQLDKSDFHFSSFLQAVVEICRIKAEQKEIAFTYQALNQLPTAIHADEKRLRQVLINLLGNAIKFTDTGGVNFKVGVINQSEPTDSRQIKIHRIRFQIEDTGVGMTPEQLEKIFLPFEQVGDRSRQTEGTGLGLAISRKIVQMMGSTISVESSLGSGSKFWFDVELPAALNWIESAPVKSRQNVIDYMGERRKILVVDDRSENAAVLINMLAPIGFDVMWASNGQEGIETALVFKPDLIITDLAMPVMDGYQMTRRLRESPEFKDALIIASSASVFNFDRQRSQHAGCNNFLPKPVQIEELLDLLQNYLQLTWIIEESEELTAQSQDGPVTVVAPPPEELVTLYEAAQGGYIADIQVEANRLKQLDPKYTTFAKQLLDLAEEFEDEKILNFVEQYVSR